MISFQFHDGSIQAGKSLEPKKNRHSVSIPRWFDSSKSRRSCSRLLLSVSIPRWFDSSRSRSRSCAISISVSIPRWFDSSYIEAALGEATDIVSIPRWFDSSLEPYRICLQPQVAFQFHDGSIQANLNSRLSVFVIWFQFHDGSIQALPAFLVKRYR